MKYNYIFFITFILLVGVSAQDCHAQTKTNRKNTLEKMQGTWQSIVLSEDHLTRYPEPYFLIIQSDSCFSISLSKKGKLEVNDTSKIFLTSTPVKSIDKGKNENIFNKNGNWWFDKEMEVSLHIDFINDTMELYNPKGNRYGSSKFIKINKISKYYRVQKISNIYELPNNKIVQILEMFDPIQILEEKSGWLRVRFYGKKLVEGWIRKGDVE